MTALVSPLTRVSKAGVSTASVDDQIDEKNQAQNLQINLDYADRPTTYNKSEVYNKTESDAALALKGSAAQLATVTAYANTLPTTSTVNGLLDARFILRDGQNFVTYGAKSDVTANTAAIATATAATVTNQSGIAAVNNNIANILTGSAALETLNVSNETVGGKNTLEIKNKPDAINTASLQIKHVLTASAQQAKVNFWDTSIPNSSSTSSATALTLSWDGDADTHTSTFAGGLTVAGTMACTNLICTNIATLPGGGAASVGEVLKSTRVCKSPHSNVTLTGNSSTITCTSQSYTPISTNSLINVTFVGTRMMAGTTSSWGQWLSSIVVNGVEIGNTMHGHNSLSQHVDSAPIFASYTNSSLSPITFTVTLRSITGGGTAHIMFYQQSGAKSCWFHFEEVQA